SLKTLYRKRTVIWPFYFYTIIRTLSKKKNIPHDLNVSLQISNKYINTKRPNYSKKEVIEVGVFNHEKANTND
ncbi:DUF1672 family protein, partial [Staphylococcus aureus]|nr:DUF1672 family protein [Staphylococcus aureus]